VKGIIVTQFAEGEAVAEGGGGMEEEEEREEGGGVEEEEERVGGAMREFAQFANLF